LQDCIIETEREINIDVDAFLHYFTQQTLSGMTLSKESWAIRHALGEFLQKLAFVDQRWIRIDSCSNKTFKRDVPGGETVEVDCPLESFCDLLGISAKKANEYLCAANLMKPHNRHNTLGLNREGWDALKNEFCLDIDLALATDTKHLGSKVHVIRIGCLCDDNPTTLSAKKQATRFFETGWKPKWLRVASQANDFISKTSSDLTIFMAKLDEKEREERKKEASPLAAAATTAAATAAAAAADAAAAAAAAEAAVRKRSVQINILEKDKPVTIHGANGKDMTWIRVPKCSTLESCTKSLRISNFVPNLLHAMADKEQEEEAALWLFLSMGRNFPNEFEMAGKRLKIGIEIEKTPPRKRKSGEASLQEKRKQEKKKTKRVDDAPDDGKK
jgi:hypothetical protein